jgi:hypothetical protein
MKLLSTNQSDLCKALNSKSTQQMGGPSSVSSEQQQIATYRSPSEELGVPVPIGNALPTLTFSLALIKSKSPCVLELQHPFMIASTPALFNLR